jgi:hypothetical protein
MVEVGEYLQTHAHDVVRGHVVEVGHEADAAGVVLEAWVVEAGLWAGVGGLHGRPGGVRRPNGLHAPASRWEDFDG